RILLPKARGEENRETTYRRTRAVRSRIRRKRGADGCERAPSEDPRADAAGRRPCRRGGEHRRAPPPAVRRRAAAGPGRPGRVAPGAGAVRTFRSGLPKQNPAIGLGGVMDVAFVGGTAYALVTLVGPDVGGSDVAGIYRVDGPHTFTVVADIGAWATAHPPA